MRHVVSLIVILLALIPAHAQKKGWIKLFDGKTLDGWRVGANASSFSVQDGAIVVLDPGPTFST